MNTSHDIDLILRREATLSRKSTRAITFLPVNPDGEPGDPQPDIDTSGAVHLNVNDIIPTLDAYGMGLPPSVQISQGVIGHEVWPVSADDVEMEEQGEVHTLEEQDLSFATLTSTPQRVSLLLNVSNTAIDNAAFNIVEFLRGKMRIALKKYLARHFYSFENWEGNKGPWANATTADIAQDLAAGIEAEMTHFHEAGFDLADAYVVMDLRTERILKQLLVADGSGRTIIHDGLCLGYPYIVSKYFGTQKDANGNLVPVYEDVLVGVGVFNWFAISQHAGGRIVFDGHSAAVAKNNTTSIVVNTWWSFTNLASGMATSDGSTPTFKLLYTPRYVLADIDDNVFNTSDDTLLVVGAIPIKK